MPSPGFPRLPIDPPRHPVVIESAPPPQGQDSSHSLNPLAASLQPGPRGESSLMPAPTPSQAPSRAPRRFLGRGLAVAAVLAVGVVGSIAAMHADKTPDRVTRRRVLAPSIEHV